MQPVNFKSSSGFTLIELLVVIAILAILATVTVLVINPAQLFAQARDSRRLSDLQTINSAMKFIDLQGISEGAPNKVYISIPDTSSTCAGLSLPALPVGWSYACATSANYRKVDGTGWIPVNFTQLTTGAPMAALPIDPINTVAASAYYSYIPGGSWELNAKMESEKYVQTIGSDGGDSLNHYEIGSDLALSPKKNVWTGIGDFENDENGFSDYGTTLHSSTAAYGSQIGGYAEYIKSASSLSGGGNYGGIHRTGFPSLTVGQTYTISVYAKNISGSGTVVLHNQSGGGDGSCLSFNFVPTNTWQKYSNTCVLDYVKPILYIWVQDVPNDEFLIDGLQIEPGA